MHSGGGMSKHPSGAGEWCTSPLPCAKAWPSGQQNCACTTCSPASFKAATDPRGPGHCLGASVTLTLVCRAEGPCAPGSPARDRAGTEPALCKAAPRSRDMMLWPWRMARAPVGQGHSLSLQSQGKTMGSGLGSCTCKSVPFKPQAPPPLPAPPANLSLSYVNQTRFGACPEKPFNYCCGWRSLLVIVSPAKMDLAACQSQFLPSFTRGEAQRSN